MYKLKVTKDINALMFVQLNVCVHTCACMHACVYTKMYQFLQLQESRVYRFMAMDCFILILI